MWWQKFRKKAGNQQGTEDFLLEQELWKAHKEWELAHVRLNDAMDKDEIDYAVFMLEAAEKRYGMLLRRTKEAYQKTTDFQESRAGGNISEEA